jgi:nicotinamidase-related amidase
VFINANVPTLLRALEPEAITVYGVATDFCDKYTIEGLLRHWPRAELFLVSDAVRAIHPEQAERLLGSWQERGVRFLPAAEVLAGRGLERYLAAPV